MSKKCCGLIYKDTDTVCKICGKPLKDEVVDNDNEYNKILEEANRVADDVLGIKGSAPAETAASDTDGAAETYDDNEADETDGGDDIDETDSGDDTGEADSGDDIDETDSGDDTDDAESDETDNNDEADWAEPDGTDRFKPKNRFLGIITLIAAVLGFAGIVFCIIVFVISPAYKYTSAGMNGKNLVYPEISTSSDATAQDALLAPTDIQTGMYFDDTATAGDASVSDAEEDGAPSGDGQTVQQEQE